MPRARSPDSLRSQILDWDVYQEGTEFGRREVAQAFGAHPDCASDTLSKMASRGELVRTSSGYCRPARHWIHTMRLAQPVPQ